MGDKGRKLKVYKMSYVDTGEVFSICVKYLYLVNKYKYMLVHFDN